MSVIQELLKVVLVEPAGALNVGSIARLCENFGVSELRLVSPRCDPMDPDAKKMAVKGTKLLNQAQSFDCLLDAISDCNRVLATCGRIDHGDIPLFEAEKALPWLAQGSSSEPIAIVFGREDRGLTNQELLLAQKVLTLKTSPNYPSLNLSHAVAIVLHEFQKYNDQIHKIKKNNYEIKKSANPLEVENCLEDTKSLLLDIGFLMEHTAQPRMAKIKALLNRAEVKPEEVSLIRGILRQVRWAIKQ